MPSIAFVGSTGYLAFLERVKESEECYTHVAQVHTTEFGTDIAYIKFYPDEIRDSKGLVNEAIGHLVAKALGVPIPAYGIILLLDRVRLVEAHPALNQLLPSNRMWPAWVSQRVHGVSVRRPDAKSMELLKKWPLLPRLIAFDDWLLNSDRSLRNLLQQRTGEFVAIDHGHIFGGVRWDQSLLTPDMPFQHPFVMELWNGNPPSDVSSKILEAAQGHHEAYTRMRPDLDDLLDKLLENQGDRNQLRALIEHRAAHSYDRIKKSLGVLI